MRNDIDKHTGPIKTQLHYAKKGIVTEEMHHIANIEELSPELVRKEVAKGRLIIPANIHHKNLEPMGIGIALKTKINANIGSSAIIHSTQEEVEKLQIAIKYGADTVMDLSTAGDLMRLEKKSSPPRACLLAPCRCIKSYTMWITMWWS